MGGSLSNGTRLAGLLYRLLKGCTTGSILNDMSRGLLFAMCCTLSLLLILAGILFIHIFLNSHGEYRNLFCILKFLISMFRQHIFNL
jgi:hypothetical protein